MKIKTILIAMCSTAVLFSSCEKAEMDKGTTGGGGMIEGSNSIPPTTPPTTMDKGTTGGGGMIDELDPGNRSISPLMSLATNIEKTINVLRSVDVNDNLGVVSVTIANSDGVIIYSNSVDTSLSTTLLVDRDQFATGNYRITIATEDNTIIEQDSFVIE